MEGGLGGGSIFCGFHERLWWEYESGLEMLLMVVDAGCLLQEKGYEDVGCGIGDAFGDRFSYPWLLTREDPVAMVHGPVMFWRPRLCNRPLDPNPCVVSIRCIESTPAMPGITCRLWYAC